MKNYLFSLLTRDASTIKNHLNVLRFKTIEKRAEEYNKFLVKRFFKDLKKTTYNSSPDFLKRIWEDMFQEAFDKKEWADAFGCEDVFAESPSAR